MTDLKLIEDKSKLAILYFKSQEYEKALGTYNVLINQLKISQNQQSDKSERTIIYKNHLLLVQQYIPN